MTRPQRRAGWGVGIALALAGLTGASACGNKNSSAGSDGNYEDITKTFDETEVAPAERKPVESEELDKLPAADKQRFERVVDKLPSPCGKAHSLRTSRNTDKDCARARFAVDYVLALMELGATDDDVREYYTARYSKDQKKRGFRLDKDTPHVGPEDGRVVLVEFFDYGCPGCKEFAPELKQVVEAYPNDLVVYYKQYPLPAHEFSKGAAQAALAAGKQDKYHEMHDLLFANQEAHKKDDLTGYARQLGLDMRKFETDFAAALPQVEADKREGSEAGVDGTPTWFINGRKADGLPFAKMVKNWVEEELAVNR